MMNSHEAIKSLDGYSEALISLSVLLGAKMFNEKSDEHEGLLVQIKEQQKDGRWMAREIMKEMHRVGTQANRSGDVTGIGAAIQRYVAADNQASEALKKGDEANAPNPVAEAIAAFKKRHGLISR